MTKAEMNPLLMRSNTRFFIGMFIVPLSILSIVLILAANPHPLFAIFPMPAFIIGTAMIALELRNRIEKQGTIVDRPGTAATQLHERKLSTLEMDHVVNHRLLVSGRMVDEIG